jgi:hypothetical protein
MLLLKPTPTISRYDELTSYQDCGSTLADQANAFSPAQRELQDALAQLQALRKLSVGWDGYAAPAPADSAFRDARRVIERAIGEHLLIPSFVLPSAEGGIGIGFRSGGRYADIECFNSGETLALTSDGNGTEPRVWEIHDEYADLTAAFEAIGEHLGKCVSAGTDSKWSTG